MELDVLLPHLELGRTPPRCGISLKPWRGSDSAA